eukprot:TRINITY_DN874_c0_g1_i1.p1 TRINITY_DN874_c0_g1~~TRINITY_DN874_c0_g1_i1.p1  ORF type:complete len:455 (+),score=68.84 TRINITY_DN874_c0_g1_i1:288-1652(+)
MIFEYISGGELFDYIVSHGRLRESDARRFFRDIISALEYCHYNLIIHRDLKPENLLLQETEEGQLRIKISDFGLANIMVPGKKFSTFCGSLHYACPEILRGEKYLGPGVDIWSMGVILYCLVVGRQPWDADSAQNMVDKIMTEGIEIPEWVSDDCVDLILKMLRVNESDRIPLSEMKKHPFVMEGYDEPPTCYIPRQASVTQVDESVIKQLVQIGFPDTPESRSEILQNERTQLVATYHILLQKKNNTHQRRKDARKKRDDKSKNPDIKEEQKKSNKSAPAEEEPIKAPKKGHPDLDSSTKPSKSSSKSPKSNQQSKDVDKVKKSNKSKAQVSKTSTSPRFGRKSILEYPFSNDSFYECSMTSSKTIPEIKKEVIKVLELLSKLRFKELSPTQLRVTYTYQVKDEDYSLKFLIDFVELPKNKNLSGIKFVRMFGDVWAYKAVYEQIATKLKAKI